MGLTKLKPFQEEGVQGIWSFYGRCLLADDMGLGKTIQALTWIDRIPSRRPVVIVCPSSVKYNWQAEASLHLNMRTEVLDGRRPARRLPGEIVIINYQILQNWLPLLLKAEPRVVVLDEIHFIKNLRSQRTLAALRLCENADSVLGLSGTPLTNRPVELWPVLRAIKPSLFPSFEKFAWEYCKPHFHPRYGWRFDGATKTKKLRRILKKYVMIRRRKKDVLTQLPNKTRRYISFKMAPKQEREYRYAEEDFLAWLEERHANKVKKASKAKELAQIGYLLRLAVRIKLPWTLKWLDDFFEGHPGEQLVAFSMHRFVIDAVKEHFGNRCVVVDGRVTGRKREESIRLFRSNPKKVLFMGQWQAAGIGINLVNAAYGVGLDLPWTPADLMQGEDRIHRMGQKYNTLFTYLILMGTIEEKLMAIQRTKRKVLNAVLDGDRNSADLDIFKELLKSIK